MALLYKLSLGTSILEQFVDELMGQEHALLVLPNRYQMEKVQFISIPCTGIDTLANRILNENGYLDFEQINRRTQELLIEELINMMMEAGRFTYFAKLADKDGFLKSMTTFMGELARTGLTTEEIVENFKRWQEETSRTDMQIVKDSEVLMLYMAYRNYLKEKNWYDLEGKYRLAVHLLKQADTKIPWTKLRIFGFYTLDKLQVDLFRELAKHVDLSIAMYYGEEEAYLACRDTYNSLLDFCKEVTYKNIKFEGVGVTLSQSIFTNKPIAHSAALSTDGLSLVKLNSRDKEIRYVFTEIKKLLLAGVDSKDIVIVVRNLDNFTGLGAVADEYGMPISLGKSCKLSNHNIFSFVKLLFLSTLETHEGAENYFKLLSNPLLSMFWRDVPKLCLELKKKIYFNSSSQARQVLEEALEEKNDYLNLTNTFICTAGKAATLEDFISLLKSYLSVLAFPKTLGNIHRLGGMSIDGLKSSLEAFKTLDNCLDMLLEDYKLCGREKEKLHPLKWLEVLTEAANSVSAVLAHGRQDGIRIMEAANMQGLSYKYVYLMGLRLNEFPTTKNESWVYNDTERNGLNIDLATTYASLEEDAYFFAATLASAEEKLCISYHEEEEGEKSPYVDELQRVFLNQRDGEFVSNLPISVVEDKEIVSANELWEKHGINLPFASMKDYTNPNNVVLALSCADMEWRDDFSRYHGKMQDEKLVDSLKQCTGKVFSASSLNEYINCPYAYLLDRVMKLGDGNYKEEEGSPADKGSIIHSTLSGFINQHLNSKLKIEHVNVLEKELDEIFEAAWNEALTKGVVNASALWQAEKPRILTLLHNWLLDEIINQIKWDYKPIATELKFFGKKTNPTIKLELTDGSKVELEGAIDRVDSNGEKLFVTDYKLTSNSVPTSTSILQAKDLQMDIYMLAAKKHMQKPISGGGYYALSGLSRKRNLLFEENGLMKKDRYNSSFASYEEFESSAKTFIVELIEKIYEGDFTPSGKNCTYCPYADICRKSEGLPEKEDCENA